MRRARVLVAIAILALIAAGAPAVSAAGPRSPVASNGGRPLTARAQARAIAYWTPARMRAARAMPAPSISRTTPVNGLVEQSGRRPMLVEGSTPGDAAVPRADPSPTEYAYPFPFTRYGVESQLYTIAPYKWIGKIFFRSGGANYVCSGASVAGGFNNVVYTAGHCLHEGNGLQSGWSTNVVFVPAYRNGVRPFGTFAARLLWVPGLWKNAEDFSYDLGAFSVGKNASGKTLRKAVGYLGFAWNMPDTIHWNSFGYPAAAPFNGQTLHVCQASRATNDLTTGVNGGPYTQAIGCDMTGGSSGGPWVWRTPRDGQPLKIGNYLNSVNSYGYDDQPAAMYGPYFDDVANNLRCAAGKGDPNATTC